VTYEFKPNPEILAAETLAPERKDFEMFTDATPCIPTPNFLSLL